MKQTDQPLEQGGLKTVLSGLLTSALFLSNSACDEINNKTIGSKENRHCDRLYESLDENSRTVIKHATFMKNCRAKILDGTLIVTQKDDEKTPGEKAKELMAKIRRESIQDTLNEKTRTKTAKETKQVISNNFILESDINPQLRSFLEEIKPEGYIWAGKSQGNGNREVVIYMAPNRRNKSAYQKIFHFSGQGGEKFNKSAKEGIEWENGGDYLMQGIEAVQELSGKGENIIFVYPLSAGKRADMSTQKKSDLYNNGRIYQKHDMEWMLPGTDTNESFNAMNDEVDSVLKSQFRIGKAMIGKTVVQMHRAGGIVFPNMAGATSGVDEYLSLNGSFNDWMLRGYGDLAYSQSKLTLVIAKGTGPDKWCDNIESASIAWEENRNWCEDDHMGEVPAVLKKLPCYELEERAMNWESDEAKEWCADLANNMINRSNISVVRPNLSKFPSRKFPRNFTARLDLK